MTPHDYKRLLAAANLAHYHPKRGVTILVDRWKMFLEGHHLYTHSKSSCSACSASLLPHQLSMSSCCAALSSSRRASSLLRCLLMCRPFFVSSSSSRCPLILSLSRRAPSRFLVTPAGCHIISHHPLIVLPSRSLIIQAGCC